MLLKVGIPIFSFNLSNTSEDVKSDFQTPRSGLRKSGATKFLNQLRGVWKSDETVFRVFDIASQTIDYVWRSSKQKFTKFCDNSVCSMQYAGCLSHELSLMALAPTSLL